MKKALEKQIKDIPIKKTKEILTKQIDKTEAKLIAKTVEYAKLERAAKEKEIELTRQLEQIQHEKESLEQENLAIKNLNHGYEEKFHTAEQELQKLKKQSAEYQNNWISSLTELETSQAKIAELNNALKEANNLMANLTTEKDSLFQQTSELKKENATLQEKLQTAEVAQQELNNNLAKLRKEENLFQKQLVKAKNGSHQDNIRIKLERVQEKILLLEPLEKPKVWAVQMEVKNNF